MININGIVIANNIRAERSRANITIQEITNKLGISRPTYVDYEKDASNVKTKTLLELANLFKCDINSFFV